MEKHPAKICVQRPLDVLLELVPALQISVVLFVLAFGSALHADHHRQVLRLSAANLAPYLTEDDTGYLGDFLVRLLDEIDCDVKFVRVAAARGLHEADVGRLDGDAARVDSVTQRYTNLVRLPVPVLTVNFTVFTHSTEIRAETVADLAGYKVGYIRGWQIARRLFKDHPNATTVRTAEALMSMLQARRIDAAFITDLPGRHIAQNLGFADLSPTEFSIKTPLFLHLHRTHAQKIGPLLAAYRRMEASGELVELRVKYGVVDD